MWSQDEPCVTSSNWVKFSEGKLKNVLMLTINLKPKIPLDGAGHHCSALWDWGSLQEYILLIETSAVWIPSIWFDLSKPHALLSSFSDFHHCGIGQPERVCFVNENHHIVKPFVFWEGNQQAHTCALDAVGMPLYLGFKHTTVVLLCHPEMLTFGNGHLRNLKPFVSSSKPLGSPVLWKKAEEMFSNKCQASTRWCWQFKLTSSH